MRINRLFSVLILTLLITGCKDSSILSHNTTETITIDGKLDEWTQYPLQHFESEHFSISFLHDSQNLYLILATRDRQMMKIVQTSGIQVWLDEDNNKKKEYGLHFVGNIDTLNFSQGRDKLPPNSELPKIKRQKPGTILFSDFGNEYLLEKFKPATPEAAVDIYKSAYLMEFRIPFSSDIFIAHEDEDKPIKIQIGLELGHDMSEMKKQKRDSHSGGKGGMGGRGGGGRGGGGPGGGGGPSGGGGPGGKMDGTAPNRNQPYEKIEKWFTVTFDKMP